MLVSKNWLQQYVELEMSTEDLIDRLTMSGLNFDGMEEIDGDLAINLEVTSNRPDCLGHIGIAREIAVLFGLPLRVPDAESAAAGEQFGGHGNVEIVCPDLCYRYTARLIKGVRIGPSPDWMQRRLATIGVPSVNNVVDATNYVMFECGQPLHAFDFAKIAGRRIVVRQPNPGETMTAIDHRTYNLQAGMCLIADASNAIAIGGVMGGAVTEISSATTEVLLEAAHFNPLSVRDTARSLNLHSPSSFRFERAIDPEMVDWASRRCCSLIAQIAGGTVLGGSLNAGFNRSTAVEIGLRRGQIRRVLGIEVPTEFVSRTLVGLGLEITGQCQDTIKCTAPSWRQDLTREVDLVEEIGRIYGYEHVPDTARVPMAASYKTASDRVVDKVRLALCAAGFDEAMTASLVPEVWSQSFSPWTDAPPLVSSQPMLGVLEKASQNVGPVEYLRRSLIPSLLEARRINEYRANSRIELFEVAKVYLPRSGGQIPDQPAMAGMTSGRGYFELKGVVQALLNLIGADVRLECLPIRHPLLDVNQSCQLEIGGQMVGILGMVSAEGQKQFGLRQATCIAELHVVRLQSLAVLVPIHRQQSPFPGTSRDFNLIINEEVRWADIESTVRLAGGKLLESIKYLETFRDERKDGTGKKRVLLSVTLRSPDETLTGDKVELISQQIIQQCRQRHQAVLLA